VEWTEFTTRDGEALIAGLRAGDGPPVLLLHGGPGLGFDYLRDLAEELAEENDVAWYQQRGQAPSAVEGPHTVATDVDDARRVLDALDWDKAYVVGHSWGGHLALHVAEALPDRVLGVLSVDPLGAIGDGRWPEFDEEIFRRTPESVRARARELDELSMKGEADDALALEGMRLVWPAYFADPEAAPPMPELRMASERSAQMVESINAELPKLEAGLPGIRVPVGFVHGSRSPMPLEASTDAAERIPGAWVDVVEGAGHFIWVEAPGAVRESLRLLTGAN
jgi:pimeloyl-ACP methyl ester carboxylesterase